MTSFTRRNTLTSKRDLLCEWSTEIDLLRSIENNGLDSLICGSLYDYGFAYDGNYAHQLHHRLFETTTQYGQMWRNDLIAINICRAREHGIASYNTFRDHYGFTKADYFEDLGDTINYEGILLLKKIYKSVEIYFRTREIVRLHSEMSVILIYSLA